MNVIFKMKNDILKERLKNLLIKKFIYRLMNQYIESYNKGNSDNIEKNNKDKYGLLESQKRERKRNKTKRRKKRKYGNSYY